MTEEQLKGLKKLDVPVPQLLERGWGYSGDARFVAFYWDMEIGELRFDDGANDEDADWELWDLFLTHETVRPQLVEHALILGLAGGVARHFLLLDRTARALYAGDVAQISGLMRGEIECR